MKKAAIVCPIKDELTYIDKFLEYYRKHFDREDIYILDFGSSEEYLQKKIYPYANVIKSDKNILDAQELFEEIKKTLKHLKYTKDYNFVLPLDVDEFIVYNKEGGIGEFLRNGSEGIEIATCQGYQVIHIPGLQEDFKPDEPWSDQLQYWFRDDEFYGKTVITEHLLDWAIGFHKYRVNDIASKDPWINKNLFLVHLHSHDYKTTIERHLKWSKKKWSEKTIEKNQSYHYRINSKKDINEWYFKPILENRIYEIPQEIKNKLSI